MNQLPLFEAPRWTITELTRAVRRLLESDERLQDLWVQGEISNFSRPASGHLYFTLKDSGASLRCVMWKPDAARMKLPLQDGLSIEAHGKIGVYEPGGQYQFYADLIRPAGEGQLYAEFMRLKSLLEVEGLFDPARKRPVPQFPRTIGIVTSPTGAALRDMLNVLRRRLPLAEVVLAASPVQGAEAPHALVLALQKLNALVHPDVILLARGGGSIEDLWAFNYESVVRAVAVSAAPVISGVGHETDFTLVDFAADLRAPTPTAAAELATPYTVADLSSIAQGYQNRLTEAIAWQLVEARRATQTLTERLRFHSPARHLLAETQRLDDLSVRSSRALAHRLQLERLHINTQSQRLESLSPLAVLKRGYAVVTRRQDGVLVHNAQQAPVGSELRVRLAEGELDVQVQESRLKES
ncbi:MAG: exodeoxyribonuclease VII large subunit [Anaerolineales bacterium]